MRDNISERTVWRVRSGSLTRWFGGKAGAKQWADDRFDTEFDGIPYIDGITLTEALTHLNEMELGRATFMESYSKDLSSPSK